MKWKYISWLLPVTLLYLLAYIAQTIPITKIWWLLPTFTLSIVIWLASIILATFTWLNDL